MRSCSEAEEERDVMSSVLIDSSTTVVLPTMHATKKDVSELGDLDLCLDIFNLDLHAKIQACMSVRLARIVRRTDTHTQTDTQTMPKLLHPPLTLGVMNEHNRNKFSCFFSLFLVLINSKEFLRQVIPSSFL